jgi:hypothetical protein
MRRMRRLPELSAVIVAATIAATVGFACSSSSSNGGGADAGGGDAPPDVVLAAPDNCVPKGFMGNSLGVGAFCDDTTTCPSSTKFLICTAYHGAPSNAFFCTTPCTVDGDCGENAFCDHHPEGSGCVPDQCGPPRDGGGDAPADGAAPLDGSSNG